MKFSPKKRRKTIRIPNSLLLAFIAVTLLIGLIIGLSIINHNVLEKKEIREFLAPQQAIKAPGFSGFINLHPSISEGQEKKIIFQHEKMLPIEEPKINGYIVEFKENPLLAKELEVKSASTTSAAEQSLVGQQKQNLVDEHAKAKEDLKNILGKSKTRMVASAEISSPDDNSLKILDEYYTVFNGMALDISAEDAQKIKKESSYIKEVYPNYQVYALLDKSVPVIKADQARNLFGLTGEGVTIAVIDTGIDAKNPSLDDLDDNNLTNDPKIIGWKDYINFRPTPYDDFGHGTHCAGIAAGTGGGTPYIGLAPKAKLVGVKVLDESGSGDFATIIAGIEWVVQNKNKYNISIISMSLGASINSDGTTPIEIAADLAVDYGINFVAAAGNSGAWGNHTVGIPACAKKIITVGAIDNNMDIAYFSSRGPTLDGRIKPEVVAPGVNIHSSVPTGDCYLCNPSGWMDLSGTSMATPHVAGMVALLLQKNSSLTPTQIRNLLMETSTDKGDVGPDNTYGYGVVDAINAVIKMSPPAHEVSVEKLDVPDWIQTGNTLEINATILNQGLNNEQLTYKFFINGTQLGEGSKNMPSLTSTQITNFWTPNQAGDYELKVIIDDLSGDLIPYNNEQVKTVKVVNVSGTIKAVVVDSWGNYYSQYTIFDELKQNWFNYGNYIVDIDHTSLAKESITYSDIAATNADVLILSNAWDYGTGTTGKNMQFTDSEIAAINQYVKEGHGIIGTAGTLSNDYVPNNMKLAPLFGFTESNKSSWAYNLNGVFDILAQDDILTRNIENPYESNQYMTVAFLDINNSLPVTLVAESKSNNEYNQDAFITAYKLLKGASVYFTHIIEYNGATNDQDKQFFYNSLVWTKLSSAEQQHDIAVYNLGSLSNARLNQEIAINATVKNTGATGENNIAVKFFVDGVEKDSHTISSLLPDETSDVIFSWIADSTGKQQVSVRSDPVSGENVLLNNQVGKSIIVAGAYFTGNYYDSGIDTNNDSMYNYLNINLTIDVQKSDYYNVHLCLYTPVFGTLIVCADWFDHFNIGLNNVSVLVNGIDIRKIELNGPYSITELYLYDNDGNVIDQRNDVYNTSPYNYEDFQAMADVTGQINYLEENPIVNQTVNISVTISNIGYGVDATNVTASLYEYGYSDGSNWLENTTLIGTKDFGTLSTGIELAANFSWTPNKFGEYELMLVVNATNDLNQDNNIVYNWIYVISDAPDVSGYVYYMQNLLVNKSNNLTADVANKGAMAAQNVTASLFERRLNEDNQTLIGQINVGTIESGKDKQVIFNWTPNKTGNYYINLSVNCINDSNLNNNANYMQTKVITDNPDLILYWWLDDYNWVINQVKSINLNVENRGTKTATNLNLVTYDFSESVFSWFNINQTESTEFNGTSYNVTVQYSDVDNALVDISYDSNHEQLNLFVNQVVKLNNGVFLALSHVNNESAGIFLGQPEITTNSLSGTIESGGKSQSYPINFTPKKVWSHLLILFLNTSADADWSDNYQRTDFYVSAECMVDSECNSGEYCDNGVCICVLNLVNSSWSNWTNITCLINDKMNQTRTKTQYDSNNCGTIQNKTFVEYLANESCDYCTPNWIARNSSCNISDKLTQWYNDTNNCYNKTELLSDNNPPAYQTLTCNYCSYGVTNSSRSSWQNQGICLTNNSQLQNRSMIEYDSNYNSCYLATHLPTDLWNNGNNNTYWEYNYTGCDYCIEDIQGPFNTSCMPNNTLTTYWISTNNDICCNKTRLASDCTINNVSYTNYTQNCVYSSAVTPAGGGGGGGSSCKSSWTCDSWSKCKSGKQTRVCSDKNRCKPANNIPATSQDCKCYEQWVCSDWSPKSCDANKRQTRTCEDLNDCRTYMQEPELSRTCEYQPGVEVVSEPERPQLIEKIICNFDKTCNYDETPSTCPSDCKRSYKDTLIVGIITILALALLTGFVFFERKYPNIYSIPAKIKKEVVDLVNMGKSFSEINSYLSFKGFKKKEIEKSIKYVHNFRLLKRYVETSIDQGYTIESVKKVIRESKWPNQIIKDVLDSIEER